MGGRGWRWTEVGSGECRWAEGDRGMEGDAGNRRAEGTEGTEGTALQPLHLPRQDSPRNVLCGFLLSECGLCFL